MSGTSFSETKQALLDRLLEQKGLTSVDSGKITRSQQTGPAPLSFGQHRLWFLQQLDPASHIYHIPVALKLEGSLHVDALRQSLNEVIRRHESLRTVFQSENGQPVQVVTEPFQLGLTVVSMQAADARGLHEEIARHAKLETAQLFNLNVGPLLRAKLLRINESEHILLLCMHHIIADGWSISVLLRDLAALYNAQLEGRVAQLPELPIQYRDFALWQRQQEQRDRLPIQISYWKEQLKEISPVLELPTDHARSQQKTFRGSAVPLSISKELTAAFRSIGRSEGATLFMTIAAAFSTLLFRYSGQDDITVGIPVAGRNRPELEELIGFFVNTLVLRTRFSEEMTFRGLLRSTKETCLNAYAHQDVPFERLVEELHPERDLSHSPLFQVMLDLQNTPAEPAKFNGLYTALLPVANETAKFDLILTLYDAAQALNGALEFSTELFEDTTVHRIVENFCTLLAGIAAHPDTNLSLLPLLSEVEIKTLLLNWSRGACTEVQDWMPIPRLFEQQVDQTPDNIAIVCDGKSLSYRELNQQANQLARYLRACGAGPEVLIGIFLERSVDLVVSALAVLKAGAAYTALDTAYPRERLNSIINDSGPALVLTNTRLRQHLPQSTARVICFDVETVTIKAFAEADLHFYTSAENVAYVIYTSGSTGQPKGVAVSYGNLAHSTHVRLGYYKEAVTAFLLLSSFSFDSSVAGFFWTLCCGGKLVIPTEGSHHDPVYLAALIQEHSVSHFLCLPSLYRLLLEYQSERLASVHAVIVAGESCPVTLVLSHRKVLPQVRLFNEYGPTEASVWSSVFDCAAPMIRESVSIGRPIMNTQIFLLDDNLELVPIGATGEIHIGGAGVARGYLHHPGLTANRFVPDPFSNLPGSRLYRSGDLARYDSMGQIEFLGRNDFQVKVRGHRIELEEVEAALAGHPAVHEVAVVAAKLGLRCCVVLKQPGSATRKDLRSHLDSKLPRYMMPSEFVFLNSLPRTPSGKVDRKALALQVPEKSEVLDGFASPRTALEEVLAAIFATVLGGERIGIHENFFECGGHSLLATQVVSRIREALQLDLPLRRIFEKPTVAGLADAILSDSRERKRITRTAELLIAFSDVSDEEAVALTEKEGGRGSREGRS